MVRSKSLSSLRISRARYASERARDGRFGIVVNRRGVNVRHLLIQIAFAGADIAHALQKLAEIAATTIFESTIIKRESLNGVLPENLGRPLTKGNTLLGFYPIADRDYHVEIVVLNNAFDLTTALDLNCCKICNSSNGGHSSGVQKDKLRKYAEYSFWV